MNMPKLGTVLSVFLLFLVGIGFGMARAGVSYTDHLGYGSTAHEPLRVVNAPEEDMDMQPIFVANSPEEDMDEQPFYVANAPDEEMGQEGSTGGGVFLYCCNLIDSRNR